MALSPDNLPLSFSLREKVIDDYSPQGAPLPEDPLSVEELVRFLGKSKDTDGTPLATIKRRASKENRRPELRAEDHATLVWVSEAFSDWEENYPLESPLRDHVQRLLPMAVAMALRDDSFFTPGVHPLHKLLDALQFGAVGWQQRLDRAGQMLEQRIDRSIEKALDWFNNDSVDLGAITRELEAANERDAQRAQRMVQRLAETEEARLKTLSARRDAALEINAGLEEFELPSAIGEFLKGPWYDSAQLALVKFGLGSREWDQMQRATRHLMESVQPVDQGDDSDRDRREQILKHLPGQLRRWLLSLEHDSDATDSAIGLVEYAHLRMRHGQKLDLVRIPPLELEEEDLQDEETDDSQYETGQWYQFEDDEGPLRAQLVLQLENDRHLLFANFVGLKALDLPKRAFRQRLDDGFALALPNQGSFSQSLASAAGIDSDERLKKYLDPDYQTEEEREAEAEAERAAQEREQAEREAAERETAEREAAERAAAEREAAERAAENFAAPQLDQEPQTQVSDAGFDPTANRADADAEEWSLPGVESSGVESSVVESAGMESTQATSAFDSSLDSSFDPAYDPDLDPVLAPPEGAEFDLDLELDGDAEVAPAENTAPSQGYTANQSGFSQNVAPQETTYTPPTSPSAPIAPAAPPASAAPRAPEPPPVYAPPSATPPATLSVPAAAEPPAPPSEPVPPAPEPVAPPQAPQATPPEYATPPPSPVIPAPTPSSPQFAAPVADTAPSPMEHRSTQSTATPPAPPPAPQAAPTPVPTPASAPYTPSAAETAPPAAPGYSAPPPPQPPSAPPTPEPAAASAENIETPPADEPAAVREVDVPMGAWLGFHDGETPIMAKLAVFDPKRDNYIFVNRKGIAMRELSRAQLAELIDKGLVDILETRCYFRDEVERARGEEP